MDRFTPTAIIVGVILLAAIGMYLGWRARTRKNSGLAVPEAVPDAVPDASAETLVSDSGLYVATTLAARPLERVSAHGLGFRARTTVTIRSDGLVIDSKGRDPFFIPLASLRAVERATWTIDKAVEPGGLVVVTWLLGETVLDSYFRMDDGQEVLLNAGIDLIEGSE